MVLCLLCAAGSGQKSQILAAPFRFVASCAVTPSENSYRPLLLRNYSSLATFLSLTVKAHVHSVTDCQLWKPQHTSVKRTIRWIGHSRSLKVIQGRTDCCHNVQQCRHYIVFPILNENVASRKLQSRRFQPPHSGLTKVIWVSRNNLYCQKLKRVVDLHFCRR